MLSIRSQFNNIFAVSEFDKYRVLRYNIDMANKEAISFRLTPEAIAIIKELAKKLGVSQADVIEMAVRKLEKQENSND